MFKEEFEAAAKAARVKSDLLKKKPFSYFLLSVLAGMFIGIGGLFAFSAGGQLAGAPATKIVMGASFGVALSLVVFAGAELFTGNNFCMTAGLLRKTVKLSDAIKLWIVCWIGNLTGGIILSAFYTLTGLGNGAVGEFMAAGALAKISAGFLPLLTRGILCNFLVCLAVWCGFRCKSESGKLIMIFWCLIAFFTAGFEHCIANMTILTAAFFNPSGYDISLNGIIWNLGVVTLGNMIGGIFFLALPYGIISNE
ncbi:MAG: formate/nitrite transporter family protein [Lachnospiraceae bacterium]|nr:formate/nitrite transporter family protein [Lachnospiraceae bacterium]